MALWMEAGSEPTTESEKADLDAISALKESAALEFKEKGNECVRKGKKHYSDAADFYTKAINQNVLSDSETSILFSNRAHVNLLLGNYRRALTDAEEAIRLSSTNVKAFYRAAKASMSLNLLNEAKTYCDKGIGQDPGNEGLKKLLRQVNSKKQDQEQHEAEVSRAVADAKTCLSAIESRGVKIGKAMFRELTGLRKPVLDKNNILHWPVLLLYAEVMTSDFIEDFCETDMLSTHLDLMFSEDCPPLPWDKDNNYTRDAIELYYEAGSGAALSRCRIIRYLLEGTKGSEAESRGDDDGNVAPKSAPKGKGERRMVRVKERRTLYDVLKEPSFIIPEIPVFYVVSKRSSFYHDFTAGKWTIR
ncbi:PREDICTED: tetratricopeptide repeat protein 4 homolog [Tarenaya hassleriana]|uniref:tetratricopeptide repeat protein 4 homolog n=1 Tax=Tarenaya hassleriana TaxID=28532 RepID=UPI00053C9BA5|nr:PREDICTED: tetratricopeptide repeat protein 4 homolog [Tarenaya hassleriana]